MTGAYVRVCREDKFVNAEIDTLSDAELERFFSERHDAKQWAMFLARWIRDNVREEPNA